MMARNASTGLRRITSVKRVLRMTYQARLLSDLRDRHIMDMRDLKVGFGGTSNPLAELPDGFP